MEELIFSLSNFFRPKDLGITPPPRPPMIYVPFSYLNCVVVVIVNNLNELINPSPSRNRPTLPDNFTFEEEVLVFSLPGVATDKVKTEAEVSFTSQ